MAAEFKINRLRFTWAGPWTASTFYNRDAVVSYNGKTYVCLVPNTSSNSFNAELNFITSGGASTPYWQVVIDGRVWKQAWAPSTYYFTGNIVTYGGTVYNHVRKKEREQGKKGLVVRGDVTTTKTTRSKETQTLNASRTGVLSQIVPQQLTQPK